MRAEKALAPPSVLAKPAGARCNLDCGYCYYRAKSALYPGDPCRMPEDVLEAYLREVIAVERPERVTIAWQGGEPTLMGVDFFRRAMTMAEQMALPGQRVEHTLQTNGTLLTGEWCRLLREHDVLVGLSLDGPRPLHDAYRVTTRRRPTFDRVMRGMHLLRSHGVRFNVLCAVHAANADHPVEVYRFLRDGCEVRFVQFIPIVERRTSTGGGDEPGVSDRSVGPDQWGCFLSAVFDEWVRNDVGRVFVQLFDATLAAWMGLPATMCTFSQTCGRAVALEHNGDVYSCDHFVDEEHLLGNITRTPLRELVESPAQRRFGEQKRLTLPSRCLACAVRFACNGECPKNRFASTPAGEPGLNYLCSGYEGFFNHVSGSMQTMAGLLRRGRPPREIMRVFAAAGRNERCPCGSGRKAKHCHGS